MKFSDSVCSQTDRNLMKRNRPRILCELIVTSCMEYTRCTNLLRSAILIYLACGSGNEEIIHRPKDESEFLAKKKTFEANIFKFFLKGEPISKFWGAANQNLCSTICDVYASWKFFTCPTPHTPWKFLPFNPPTPQEFPLTIRGGYGYFLEPHIVGAGLKILAWFDLKVFVTINFPTYLAELDPALWGGENSLSLSDSLCDVNCNKSWLTICHGVHVQYLVEP